MLQKYINKCFNNYEIYCNQSNPQSKEWQERITSKQEIVYTMQPIFDELCSLYDIENHCDEIHYHFIDKMNEKYTLNDFQKTVHPYLKSFEKYHNKEYFIKECWIRLMKYKNVKCSVCKTGLNLKNHSKICCGHELCIDCIAKQLYNIKKKTHVCPVCKIKVESIYISSLYGRQYYSELFDILFTENMV